MRWPHSWGAERNLKPACGARPCFSLQCCCSCNRSACRGGPAPGPEVETGSCQALGAGDGRGHHWLSGVLGKRGRGSRRRGEEAGWKPTAHRIHPCTSHLDRMAEALMWRDSPCPCLASHPHSNRLGKLTGLSGQANSQQPGPHLFTNIPEHLP